MKGESVQSGNPVFPAHAPELCRSRVFTLCFTPSCSVKFLWASSANMRTVFTPVGWEWWCFHCHTHTHTHWSNGGMKWDAAPKPCFRSAPSEKMDCICIVTTKVSPRLRPKPHFVLFSLPSSAVWDEATVPVTASSVTVTSQYLSWLLLL